MRRRYVHYFGKLSRADAHLSLTDQLSQIAEISGQPTNDRRGNVRVIQGVGIGGNRGSIQVRIHSRNPFFCATSQSFCPAIGGKVFHCRGFSTRAFFNNINRFLHKKQTNQACFRLWKKLPVNFSTTCGKFLWKNDTPQNSYIVFKIRQFDEFQLFFKRHLTRRGKIRRRLQGTRT